MGQRLQEAVELGEIKAALKGQADELISVKTNTEARLGQQANATSGLKKDASEMWKEQSKGLHKIMAMGEENEVGAVENFLAMHYENDLHLYRSKPTYLEIAPKKISKLTAIQHLLDHHYQIPLTQSLAFGDNHNDIEMLRGVGMGIAVGNAKPEVMEAAQHIAEPGKEDGVAKMISQIMKV